MATNTSSELDVTINLMVTRKTLLVLLDFVLDTFTSPGGNDAQAQDQEVTTVAEEQAQPPAAEPDRIRIKAQLKRKEPQQPDLRLNQHRCTRNR